MVVWKTRGRRQKRGESDDDGFGWRWRFCCCELRLARRWSEKEEEEIIFLNQKAWLLSLDCCLWIAINYLLLFQTTDWRACVYVCAGVNWKADSIVKINFSRFSADFLEILLFSTFSLGVWNFLHRILFLLFLESMKEPEMRRIICWLPNEAFLKENWKLSGKWFPSALLACLLFAVLEGKVAQWNRNLFDLNAKLI